MIFDFIILIILIITIVIGIKQGFASLVINFISFILAILLAVLLCQNLADWITEKVDWDENIKSKVENVVPITEENITIDMSNTIVESMQNSIDEATNTVNEKKEELRENIADTVTRKTMVVISFLIIFFSVRIILLVIKLLVKFFNDHDDTLRTIDKVGGFIIGLIQGLIIVYIMLGVIAAVSPSLNNRNAIEKEVYTSLYAKYFYDNNILVNTLNDKIK